MTEQLPKYRQTYFRKVEKHQQGNRMIVEHEIDQFPSYRLAVNETLVPPERGSVTPKLLSAVKFELAYNPRWSTTLLDRRPELWVAGNGLGPIWIYTRGMNPFEDELSYQKMVNVSTWRLFHAGDYKGDVSFYRRSPSILQDLNSRSLELLYRTELSTEEADPKVINVYNFDPGMGDDRLSVVVDPREGINLVYVAKQDRPERGFRIADLRQSPSGWVFRGEPEHPYPKEYESLLAGRARAPLTDL